MQKIEFLALLRQRIAILPPREIEQTVEYYSEMIDDYIESGYTSEEAVAKMGGVDNVAAQVLAGEQTPAYDAYVVPDYNFGAIDDHERYLNTIPYMQFPVMRDAKMGIGSPDAGVPDFEAMVKWLKLYKTMTSYGTWAYIDIKVPKFVKPEGDETVVTAFINRDMYIVLANYSEEKDSVKLSGKFIEVTIDGDAEEIEDEITLNPRQMKILRFLTPDEWKADENKAVGFDTTENLLG